MVGVEIFYPSKAFKKHHLEFLHKTSYQGRTAAEMLFDWIFLHIFHNAKLAFFGFFLCIFLGFLVVFIMFSLVFLRVFRRPPR